MKHPLLKPTRANIISLWFGADTPLRQYKIRMNPSLWAACQRVHAVFSPPSGASAMDLYRKSDLACFARAVLQEINAVSTAETHLQTSPTFRTRTAYAGEKGLRHA